MSFFASHMKSSFPLGTFDRCCTVIRYSRVKRNPFQKSRVKKSLKKKFRFMDAGSEAMVANFSYTTQKSNKAFFKSAFLLRSRIYKVSHCVQKLRPNGGHSSIVEGTASSLRSFTWVWKIDCKKDSNNGATAARLSLNFAYTTTHSMVFFAEYEKSFVKGHYILWKLWKYVVGSGGVHLRRIFPCRKLVARSGLVHNTWEVLDPV